MRFIFLILLLTGCISLPDTYLSTTHYEFCVKACSQYQGLAFAGKTMLGDKKSCICKNNIVIDYDAKLVTNKSEDIEEKE